MAATVVSKVVSSVPVVHTRHVLSNLTAGLPETISHLCASGTTPDEISFTLTTPPTDLSNVNVVWDSTSTSGNTITIRFLCSGSLDGAVGVLNIKTLAQASGGLTAS